MSDHSNYCNITADLLDEISTDDWDDGCEPAYVNIEEKKGDKFLIELENVHFYIIKVTSVLRVV